MIISSVDEMINLWDNLSKKHNKILLYGDLWAWKTHFTKWFARWFWYDINIVQSPTYTYINEYLDKILHIDMYRISDFDEIVEKWIFDKIEQYDNIIIEWPKFESNYIDASWTKIIIEKTSENDRKVIIDWYI